MATTLRYGSTESRLKCEAASCYLGLLDTTAGVDLKNIAITGTTFQDSRAAAGCHRRNRQEGDSHVFYSYLSLDAMSTSSRMLECFCCHARGSACCKSALVDGFGVPATSMPHQFCNQVTNSSAAGRQQVRPLLMAFLSGSCLSESMESFSNGRHYHDYGQQHWGWRRLVRTRAR